MYPSGIIYVINDIQIINFIFNINQIEWFILCIKLVFTEYIISAWLRAKGCKEV